MTVKPIPALHSTDSALKASNEFHFGECVKHVGPRGGITVKQIVARRSGATKTWKREADRFEIPIKHGLYENGRISNSNFHYFHTPEDCPLNQN